nr:reverse transcriptase domain-containing protein [Tanacetum cinerariifolium]
MDVCHALADLGARINLMPLSIWKKLSLPELTPTRMTLELADRSITRPKGVVEDVFVKVGRRSFLRTGHALIDVYGEEITLRVNDEAVTFNLNQTTRYSFTYDDLSDESVSLEIDHANCDPEGDICLIEKLLNNDSFQLPPMDLKQEEVVKAKSSIEEPPELELKELPSHLEYAYLEGADKLKGIKREYSNSRTPQQNRVAERKNMTLIKAARTMLIDSFLPTTFWVESSGDKIEKNTDFKTCEKPISQAEQIFQEELEKLKRQKKEANDTTRKDTTHENQNANTNNTNLLNGVSTPISTAGPSREFNDGEPSYLVDPLMPHLEDIYASPSEGIFTNSSYDDEGVKVTMG